MLLREGYDELVPNKTIYVSDGDLPLYQRAQDLAGGNLSAAIVKALRRFIDVEEAKGEGFDEVIVRVGVGSGRKVGRKVRFVGVLVGELLDSASGRPQLFRVYRGRTGKYVLHVEREEHFSVVDAEGKPAGWRGWIGIGDLKYGSAPKESTIEVVATLEQLAEKVPPELFEIVARSAQQPVVEELDI